MSYMKDSSGRKLDSFRVGDADDIDVTLAKNPDWLISGDVTRVNGFVTSAEVVWPDGSPGIFTPTYDTSGAVESYTITYGSPVTKTFAQPTIIRDASGAVTTIPQIVVS
jgi:hypothetical protein